MSEQQDGACRLYRFGFLFVCLFRKDKNRRFFSFFSVYFEISLQFLKGLQTLFFFVFINIWSLGIRVGLDGISNISLHILNKFLG